MSAPSLVRPYTALFVSRFQQILQYRGAAIAGFAFGSLTVSASQPLYRYVVNVNYAQKL